MKQDSPNLLHFINWNTEQQSWELYETDIKFYSKPDAKNCKGNNESKIRILKIQRFLSCSSQAVQNYFRHMLIQLSEKLRIWPNDHWSLIPEPRHLKEEILRTLDAEKHNQLLYSDTRIHSEAHMAVQTG